MATIKLLYQVICLLIVLTLLSDCINNSVSGNTSETGNAIGILYNPNGSRAANATIYIVSVDHNPKPIKGVSAIDSTTTNDTGGFFLDSMPEGYYNILGSGDSGISFNDSVYIQGDTTNEDLSDTLGEPGTLRGVVALQPGDDSRTVFILVFGTQTWTAPIDSIGNFTIASMAEGTYHVRILTTLDDYDPLDTNLSITSGIVDTLSDTIYLPFTGIPIPQGLTLSYDTMKQIITLTWNACDTNLVKGYNVYRKHSDSDFVKINTALITDTTYSDSSAIQDQNYEYKVKSVDMNDEEGKFSVGVNVVIVSVFEFISSFGGAGTSDGKFTEISDITVLNNGDIIVLDYGSHKVQKFDSSGNFLLAWGQEGATDGNFNNPIDVTFDDSEYVYVVEMLGAGRVQKFDTSGQYLKSWIVGQYCRGIEYFDNKIYVACIDTPGIKIINLSTDSISLIEIPGTEPSKVVIDTDYTIFTNDHIVKRIIVIDTNVTILNTWGSSGTGYGEFSSPSYMEISNDRHIYISDPNNGRVQVFTLVGEFITKLSIAQIPEGATEVIEEERPRGIAFDSYGNLLVADRYFIYKYTINLE